MNIFLQRRPDRGRPAERVRLRRRTAAAVLLWMATSAAALGSALDLGAYRGKVVYLDFWASWCGPCRQSFPWLDELMREYSSKDFVVIGVNVDHDPKLAERFLTDTPAEFPIVYDSKGVIASSFQVTGMPSSVLIDRHGRVRFRHTGFSLKEKDQYESDLRTLLDEPAH